MVAEEREEREERRHWHLEKSVSVTHLISTITFAFAAGWYIVGMDKRIELQKEQLSYQNEQLKQVQAILGEGGAPLRRDIDRISVDLRSVNEKLDQLILREVRK